MGFIKSNVLLNWFATARTILTISIIWNRFWIKKKTNNNATSIICYFNSDLVIKSVILNTLARWSGTPITAGERKMHRLNSTQAQYQRIQAMETFSAIKVIKNERKIKKGSIESRQWVQEFRKLLSEPVFAKVNNFIESVQVLKLRRLAKGFCYPVTHFRVE